MLYAIVDDITQFFIGFYDSAYGDLTPDANYIEIDETKRDDLLANPRQQWNGSDWEDIALSLGELKEAKKRTLNIVVMPDREWLEWTKGALNGEGWMSRLQCMELRYSITYSGGSDFYVLGVLTSDTLAAAALEDMEEYMYALYNWQRNKLAAIKAAADETALDAIDLYDYPVRLILSL